MSPIYAQRKTLEEPVNGPTKKTRNLSRFLLLGFENVGAEWHFIAGTHNLLKLFRASAAAA